MRRTLLALTDSETPIGNLVLCALALAAALAWSGCRTDYTGLLIEGDAAADAAGVPLPMLGDGVDVRAVVADAGAPEAPVPLSADSGLPLDVLPVVLPPDVAPAAPDTAPAGVYGTPYPVCSVAVALGARDCPGGTGSCRTLDGLVCMNCDVQAPCAFWSERYGGDPPARTAGPACDRGRVCMSSCPIARGGPACERPMDGGPR
jgi:hypothetical protein